MDVSTLDQNLPTAIDGITADWLSSALSQRSPGTVVESVEIESVIWGTATKVFLDINYAARTDDGPGTRLCLKGGFDDAMRQIASVGYRTEARFYRDIAPVFGDVPTCWFSADDPAANQGLVLIDDLRAVGATFGTPTARYSVDDVAASLENVARWHGTTWNRSGVGGVEWLTVGSQLFRPVVESFLDPQHWSEYMTKRQTAAFGDQLRDRDLVAQSVQKLWADDDTDLLSVSHGDPHVGNTYSIGNGVHRFLDWQTVCLAPWSDDFTYYVTGALDVVDRRNNEVDLLRHYLQVLDAITGAAPTFDDAWLAYRKHQLHGLMFALCPPQMQSPEICAAMGDRYAAAAIDLDTLQAFTR